MLLVILTDDFKSGILFRINVIISNNVLKLSFHCVNRESLCKSYARSRESSCCNENCVLSSTKLTFLTEFCILEKPILVWNALFIICWEYWNKIGETQIGRQAYKKQKVGFKHHQRWCIPCTFQVKHKSVCSATERHKSLHDLGINFFCSNSNSY